MRAAAKNHSRVAVVTDADDYDWIADEIKLGGLGQYDTFTHLDFRGYIARWDNRK